jgi:hypothetical protein
MCKYKKLAIKGKQYSVLLYIIKQLQELLYKSVQIGQVKQAIISFRSPFKNVGKELLES